MVKLLRLTRKEWTFLWRRVKDVLREGCETAGGNTQTATFKTV